MYKILRGKCIQTIYVSFPVAFSFRAIKITRTHKFIRKLKGVVTTQCRLIHMDK